MCTSPEQCEYITLVTCKRRTSPVLLHLVKSLATLTDSCSITTAAEYTWCEIEPATATYCACIVTHRPLFSGINLNFSRIPSLLSKSSTISSGDGWRTIEDGRNSPYRQRPASRGLQWRDGLHLHNLDAITIDVNIKPHGQEAKIDLYPQSESPQNVAVKDKQMKRGQSAVS